MRLRLAHLLLAGVMATPAAALDLQLPAAARLALEETEPMGRYEMPTGPWTPAGMARYDAEGGFSRMVWQVVPYGGTTVQLLAPLRAQLVADGYEVLFSCTDRDCGGFDFRFGIDVAPEPVMHVNLGDFAYLIARRQTAEANDTIALIVSRGGGHGYIHLVRVGPPGEEGPEVTLSSRAPDETGLPSDTGALIATLERTGTATLDDLQFETGASTLSGNMYQSLASLADYLIANPEKRVVLVGHTDAEGALQNNIALSRARASSVRSFLISTYDIAPERLRAEGVGYLAPRASNSTDDGRELNRRVEVVLTNTE
ncbi:MAG: OmpA family protein [Roseicyclus sp.]|nr:OmpA family protein [Roseicyclus sp.]MBO6625454.1 OmpA family protein [Roseicyclus sp.]MBO6923446.1 OmpA family protein [Roseicyclus sp.]